MIFDQNLHHINHSIISLIVQELQLSNHFSTLQSMHSIGNRYHFSQILSYILSTIAVNLRGAAVISQIVAQEMIAHSIVDASIVHISSQSSTKPLIHHTPYCMK